MNDEHNPADNCKLKIITAILEQPVIEQNLPNLGLQTRAPPRALITATSSSAAMRSMRPASA